MKTIISDLEPIQYNDHNWTPVMLATFSYNSP